MNPQVEKAIELYALFGTPASVFKTMQKEYGENCITANEVRRIREKFRNEILKKRADLQAKIPLLDPDERWARLQEIVDGALAGDEIIVKGGSYIKYDRIAALNALKLAGEFATAKGTVNAEDDELVRQIVLDAYDDLKKEKPEASEDEILEELIDGLGDKVKPFVDEIKSTQLYVQ